MMRLDKYLANLGLVSRRKMASLIKTETIIVDGKQASSPDMQIAVGSIISFADCTFVVKEKVTILLYKPAGYVCSDRDDGGHASYKVLLNDCIYSPLLHVAGRLDYDTTGLVIASSDGDLIHTIISPKRKEEKEYIAVTDSSIADEAIGYLRDGVVLDGGYITRPAHVERIDAHTLRLIITEGKYHQVKKMIEAVGSKVVSLHRPRIGSWTLDGLSPGEWRDISDEIR